MHHSFYLTNYTLHLSFLLTHYINSYVRLYLVCPNITNKILHSQVCFNLFLILLYSLLSCHVPYSFSPYIFYSIVSIINIISNHTFYLFSIYLFSTLQFLLSILICFYYPFEMQYFLIA